jgi:hypothetical protein
VKPNGRVERGPGRSNPGYVIQMRMGEQDVSNFQPVFANGFDQAGRLVTRIDDNALARILAPQDESVFEERFDCAHFKNHR